MRRKNTTFAPVNDISIELQTYIVKLLCILKKFMPERFWIHVAILL